MGYAFRTFLFLPFYILARAKNFFYHIRKKFYLCKIKFGQLIQSYINSLFNYQQTN
jgi:hypothetical protein